VPYDTHVDDLALEDIRCFLEYLADYDTELSVRYEAALEHLIDRDISEFPLRYPWFWLSGPPFRGCLFQVSRRTKFWIIYSADDTLNRVDILRFWNASRDPSKLRL
jgi:plasmid stabilization system protein ParE